MEIKRIISQNSHMEELIETYLEEIKLQKQQNQKHQNQIESLLKFNERLLYIIENQVANRRDDDSLMPISQRSERESDLMNPLNSLIKTKKTIAAKSQKGAHSMIDNRSQYKQRLETMGKYLENSTILRSQDPDQQSYRYGNSNKEVYKINKIKNQEKYSDLSTRLQSEIENQMRLFTSCAERNKKFYDSKIDQLKKLSDKMGYYDPQDKFQQLSSKVVMSSGTAKIVKNAMLRRNRN